MIRGTSVPFARRWICVLAVFLAVVCPVTAQRGGLNPVGVQDELVGLFLPKISIAADGSYGLAAEGLFRTPTGREVLRVLAQRYSSTGVPTGPTHVFAGESCSGLDLWLSDYMERPEVAFHPNGVMLVLMQHTGELQIGTDGVQSSEITMAGIDGSGQLLDLAQSTSCVQSKFIFVGGGRQDRPRFDLTPTGESFITADGFFGGASLRVAAIRVLDADGNELVGELIPHVDQTSQNSFHMYPDVATNGTLVLSAWHRCPLIDAQGNADDCDIEVQFATIVVDQLQPLGANQRVNNGEPAGTLNLYPAAAINAAGASVVAWADARDGLQGEIYAQRFDAGGQPVGANIKVSGGEGTLDTRPEVAILQNGRFMIAWTDSSAAGYRARARTFDAAGVAEGGTFELAPGLESGNVSVVADGDNFAHVYLTSDGESTELGSNKAVAFAANTSLQPRADEMLSIDAAFPNPFSNFTVVNYELSSAGRVQARVIDVLGREVMWLADRQEARGRHHLRIDGRALVPGLYFVELRVGRAPRTLTIVVAR